MIQILIADDHEIFIDALASMLRESGEIEIVATASDGGEALRMVGMHPEVDVLVLDVSMPEMDGIEALRSLRSAGCRIPALMLSQELSGGTIARAMKAGAAGYVLKTAGREEFLEAIRTIAGGGEFICDGAKDALIARVTGRSSTPEHAALTRREREVLRLVAAGLTTNEMAERLFISAYTIETHRRNLLQKLDLKNTAGLVRYAIEHGLDQDAS
jgi:DNA-binding NarL/FixJ family response regulator